MKKFTINKGLFRMNLIPYAYDKILNINGKMVKVTINPIVAMIRRNSGQSLVAVILRLLPACDGRASSNIVITIKNLLRRLSAIANSQGIIGLVKYLKQVSVLTQQIICGYRISTTSPRVKRTNSGIPSLFPVVVRKGIRSSNFFYIRFALTVSSLYRDLTYKAKPNLSSITSPFSGSLNTVNHINGFIPTFVKLFVGGVPDQRRSWLEGMFVWFPILKSSPDVFGPLSSTNPIVMVRSAGSLTTQQMNEILQLGALSTPKSGTSLQILSGTLGLAYEMSQTLSLLYKSSKYTGKLGFKQEAAGKVRVFAMVDPWTQLVMAPFHRCLFKILSKHSRIDGTFNQLGPIQRIPRDKPLYSMDLSSATDRLPIMIQTPLIRQIFNLTEREALAWQSLLVSRPYKVSNKDLPSINEVRYSVGQPMGALSSWAMLAMTHHLIVQFAASPLMKNRSLFKDYAILGDDIVIFNNYVAKRYHDIILSLGVECNLSKSIMSPKGLGLEFAKRTFLHGENVSPAPLKELASALVSLPGMIEYKLKYSLSIPQVLKVAGFGFRVIGSCNKPWGKLSIKVKYLILSIMLISKDINLIDTFPHLRFLKGDSFLSYFKEFVNEYLKNLIMRCFTSLDQASKMRPDAIPSDLQSEGYGALALPKSQRRGLRDISHKFGFNQLTKFHRNMKDVIQRAQVLQDIFLKGAISIKEIADLLVILVSITSIEQLSSKVSLKSIFERSDSENQNRRPGISKIFRMHQAYCSFLDSLRKKPFTVSPLDADTEPIVEPEMLESGLVPLTLLRRSPLLRKLSSGLISRVLIRRSKWFLGYTFVLGVITSVQGFQYTIEALLGIWTALQVLFTIHSKESPLWWVLPGVGNIILHTFELYLAGIFLSCCYYYQLVGDLIHLDYLAVQAGDFSYWTMFLDIFLFGNRLLIDTGTGVIPVIISAGAEVINSSSYFSCLAWGWTMSYIMYWFIRWFIGM